MMRYRIRHYRDDDDDGIVRLLNRSFGRDPCHEARGADWWRWKYACNPSGFRTLVAQDESGRLVGHYGSVRRPLSIRGRRVQLAEICDSCVDPSSEPGLDRGHLLQSLVQAGGTTFPGWGPYAGAYGLQVPMHYDIGARHFDYWMLRSQPILVCASRAGLPAKVGLPTVEQVTRCPSDVEPLFERQRKEEACVGWRDAAGIDWRFADRPGVRYHGAVCRDPGDRAPRGMAWYRRGEFLGAERAVIVDWIVPRGDVDAATALLWWAAELVARHGLDEIIFLCPPAHPWSIRMQDWGFRVRPTDYVFTFRPFEGDLHPAWMRRHWYYTFADTDVM